MSIGTEDADDIVNDLAQAFTAIPEEELNNGQTVIDKQINEEIGARESKTENTNGLVAPDNSIVVN